MHGVADRKTKFATRRKIGLRIKINEARPKQNGDTPFVLAPNS